MRFAHIMCKRVEFHTYYGQKINLAKLQLAKSKLALQLCQIAICAAPRMRITTDEKSTCKRSNDIFAVRKKIECRLLLLFFIFFSFCTIQL